MSTSAEPPGRAEHRPPRGDGVRLRAVPYDDPVARLLVDRVQGEYVTRYGGPDGAVVDPAEFAPPRGLFLVAEVDGVPAACGAWRTHEPGVAEVKRVYVEPSFRRRGLARLVMAVIEADAAAAGCRAVVLNTGRRQPEALALYAALGYGPVPGYGMYAGVRGAVFLGKDLPPAGGGRSWAS